MHIEVSMCSQRTYELCNEVKSRGGMGCGKPAECFTDQSPYVNQLVCAVGGVLDFVAESERRGGEQKKWRKWNLTCLVELLSDRANCIPRVGGLRSPEKQARQRGQY